MIPDLIQLLEESLPVPDRGDAIDALVQCTGVILLACT